MSRASANLSLALPAPSKTGWIVLLVVGALMALASGLSLNPGVAEAPEALLLAWFGLGTGVFLSSFALLKRTSRELGSSLEIGEGALTIVTHGGEQVQMPLIAVASVDAVERNGHDGCVLTLQKRDGGLLELGAFKSAAEGRTLAGRVRAAITEETGSAPPRDPVAQLGAFTGITCVRVGDALEIGWSSTPSAAMLLALGPFAGLGIIAYGFHRHDPSWGTILALAFIALLALLFAFGVVWSLGTRQRVTLDKRDVTIERLRFGKVGKSIQLPIALVAAVDYTHQLSVSGAALTLRTEKTPSLRIPADLSDPRSALDLGTQIAAFATAGHKLPLGRLSLAAKIALDLALSAEIEGRSGTRAGTL